MEIGVGAELVELWGGGGGGGVAVHMSHMCVN